MFSEVHFMKSPHFSSTGPRFGVANVNVGLQLQGLGPRLHSIGIAIHTGEDCRLLWTRNKMHTV